MSSQVLVGTSTLLDTLPHVRRFVDGNLGGGLDHLVVFLDRPTADGQEEVAAYLDEHPQVTCVRAGKRWWGDHRPARLNFRQCINANVVKHLLADTGGVDWLFHVDGDEVVRLDRAVLAAVDPRLPAVRLLPREAVAREHWEQEPDLFKRELEEGDLLLLLALGLVDEPSNEVYFRGHVQGKSGVRPIAKAWLGLHRAVDAHGEEVPAAADEGFELFHYESYSGEDFVRKWTAMVGSGPSARFRPNRSATARALRTLIEKDPAPERLADYLMEIFRRTRLDDAATLQDLGLLVRTDPIAGDHTPVPLPAAATDGLRVGLRGLRGVDKWGHLGGARGPADDETGARAGRRWLRR